MALCRGGQGLRGTEIDEFNRFDGFILGLYYPVAVQSVAVLIEAVSSLDTRIILYRAQALLDTAWRGAVCGDHLGDDVHGVIHPGGEQIRRAVIFCLICARKGFRYRRSRGDEIRYA